MKNNLGPSRRGKGAAVGLVICFVAVIALVGFFTFSRYKRDMSRQLAKAEEKTDTEEKQKDIIETEKSQTTNSQAIQNKAQETEKQKEETQTQTEQRQNQTSPTATQPDALAFSENDTLILHSTKFPRPLSFLFPRRNTAKFHRIFYLLLPSHWLPSGSFPRHVRNRRL